MLTNDFKLRFDFKKKKLTHYFVPQKAKEFKCSKNDAHKYGMIKLKRILSRYVLFLEVSNASEFEQFLIEFQSGLF